MSNEQPLTEIAVPVPDPQDPYALPAAMPSSADRSIRSNDVNAFSMPTRKQADWRFTPVDRIEEFFTVFLPSHRTSVNVTNIDGTLIDDALVDVREVPMGTDLAGSVQLPTDRAAAVEVNSVKNAMIIEFKRDTVKPVLVHVEGHDDALDALHLVIKADQNVHADVIVQHDGDVRLAEGVEVIAAQDATLSTTFIHEWNAGSKHVANHRIHVGQNATLHHNVVTLGGDVVRVRMDQDFGGVAGDVNLLGIYFVDPGEHIEHRTMIVHNEPECRSRVVYKGALSGEGAHSTWVGNALIQPTAPGTDSYELNRNLVLRPGAIADSEPNLEIENGNIIGAGHASSCGRFDEEELFYLQSRGISETEARKLVVRGFFAELVEEIGIDAISEHLMQAIDRRLERSETEEN